MNKKLIFQLIYVIILLGFFYYLRFSIYFLLGMGIFFVLIILLKGKLYRKINKFAIEKFSFLKKFPAWIQKLIIILSFVLIYILIKEIIFLILELFGINIREMMIDSINQSIK
jgi:hypothetical protein